MNENLIFTIVSYNFTIIFFLLVIKIVLFYMIDTKRRKFKHFLFFSESNIYGTKDPRKKKQKLFQNVLSIILLVLLLAQVIIFLSGAMFKRKIED